MIDRKNLAREVEQARMARREAEAACSTVEELLRAMRDPLAWRLLNEDAPEETPPQRTH
jgi:hypothetical protein